MAPHLLQTSSLQIILHWSAAVITAPNVVLQAAWLWEVLVLLQWFLTFKLQLWLDDWVCCKRYVSRWNHECVQIGKECGAITLHYYAHQCCRTSKKKIFFFFTKQFMKTCQAKCQLLISARVVTNSSIRHYLWHLSSKGHKRAGAFPAGTGW